MSCINVKVSHLRTPSTHPNYNLKDWLEDPQHVYIGRAGVVFVNGQRFPTQSSPFANPFKVGKHGTRAEVIAKYETYMREKLETQPGLKDQLKGLKGKTLGCWCKPEPCHGDVLLKLIDELQLTQ